MVKSKAKKELNSVRRIVKNAVNSTKVRKRRPRVKRTRRAAPKKAMRNHSVTPSGRAFLQCSLSPRDFPGVKAGIPDQSTGSTIVLRHRMTKTFTGTSTGDWTALLLPTPGIASWTTHKAPSTTTSYGGNVFPDASSLYGTGADASITQNVDAFRFVGMSFEIKPVSATLNNAGLVTVARVPSIQMTSTLKGNSPQAPTIAIGGIYNRVTASGLSSMPAYFMGHINQGVYGFTVNGQPNFPWTPLQVNSDGTDIKYAEDITQTCLAVDNDNPDWYGYGNLVPVVVTITGTNTSTSWAITVEHIIEYRATAGSLLSEAASPSTEPADPTALALYYEAANQLVPFVPADENSEFWNKFLKIIGGTLGVIAPYTGTYAGVVGAAGTLATGLATLTL